jgi:hypothetical protein
MPPDDNEVMSGYPGDGDAHPENREPAPAPTSPAANPVAQQLQQLQARIDAQDAELQHLRRATPPPVPKATPPPKDPTEEIDWDQELFTSPKKALAKYGEIIEKRVTDKLEGRYQRDRSTQVFWEQFYDKHPDLKPDHDLVDLTLKSNLAEMGSIPVDKAMDRLADLTRDRILRYAGGHKPRNPKAKVEGAGAPSNPKPPKAPEQEKVLSITDIIRRNKDRRRKVAGA